MVTNFLDFNAGPKYNSDRSMLIIPVELASKNMMACAVPQARPLKGSDEKERGDDGSNPLSRWGESDLRSGAFDVVPEPTHPTVQSENEL